MLATRGADVLEIKVGRLSSVPQLIASISADLQRFTQEWRKHSRRQVVWDLTAIQAGEINPAAIAAFCAIARRLRQFAWKKPTVRLPYIHAQSFLHGIGFFELAKEMDLFEIPPRAYGGFEVPQFHRSSQVFCIRRYPDRIPPDGESEEIGIWKDRCREEVREHMLYGHDCYRLFIPEQLPRPLEPDLVNSILNCCAEFATNAILWGRADAFIAIQVGRFSFSAAVCDAGDGLHQTLSAKSSNRLNRKPADDHESVFFASVYNHREMGLFHTITNVLNRGGNVSVSSGKSEIFWRPSLWQRVRVAHDQLGNEIFDYDVESLLGSVVHGKVETERYLAGIRREWKPGLRGVRIAFELPYREKRR